MYSSLKFNNLYKLLNNEDQKIFFTLNTNEQTRGYHIARGDTSVEYQYWNTTDKFSESNTILLDSNIIDQETYFKNNLLLQFIGYYIANNKVTLDIVQTRQFKLINNKIYTNTDPVIISKFEDIVTKSTEIIEDIIIAYNDNIDIESNNPNKPIYILNSLPPGTPDGTLGIATTEQDGSKVIQLRTEFILDEDQYGVCYLNNTDTESDVLMIVLIHEIIHILGLGMDTSWFTNRIGDPNNEYYTGLKGKLNYQNLLIDKGLSTEVTDLLVGIPIENSFDQGSVNVHFEEGMDDNFNLEQRMYNGIVHPTIPGDIMTPQPNVSKNTFSINYITILTLGVLEDMNYIVNYNSDYIADSSNVEILYN